MFRLRKIKGTRRIKRALHNKSLRNALASFARSYPQARENAYLGIDFHQLQDQIQQVKAHAVDNIDTLVEQFEENLVQRGANMHRASQGEDVAEIIKKIAAKRNAKLCVKSKSMATEEIHLNKRLQDAMRVVETDLGEWIIQQIDEKPSHMVMPAIHLTRQQCAQIFSDVIGNKVEPDIPHMVKLARQILREQFIASHIGITGCNIAVAETGTMVILTNEGNACLTTTLPPVHIVLMGYEKLVAQFKDIIPLITAIPKSATCQPITSYVTMISGPCETFKSSNNDEITKKELHVILLDNGRHALLKDPEFNTIGHCVRCASCLNVCPVYDLVGGDVFGDVYTGGIGALLTAFVHSPERAEKIQELCLGCGKCLHYCPAKIDIPGLILKLRGRIRKKIAAPFLYKLVMQQILPRQKLLDFSLKVASPTSRFIKDFPKPAKEFFRDKFQYLPQNVSFSEGRGTIAFFYGCMIDYIYPEIGEAVVYMLNRAGYHVVSPQQKCCGAPALFTGHEASAAQLAREHLQQWRLSLDHYQYIVTACPTCTVLLKKQWPRLLKDDSDSAGLAAKVAEKAIDFIQLFCRLQEQNPELKELWQGTTQRPQTVTYHDSCHLKWELGVSNEPRQALSSLPGVDWVEMEESDRCCGFAGTFSIKQPEIAQQLQNRKVENIKKSRAKIVLVDCPGCLLKLNTGLEKVKSTTIAQHSALFMAAGLKK
jgi:iron-sulfur cluster protein